MEQYRKTTHWDVEDLRTLKENFHTMDIEDLAAILGRSVVATRSKANSLGIYSRYKPAKKESTIKRPPAVYDNVTPYDIAKKYDTEL